MKKKKLTYGPNDTSRCVIWAHSHRPIPCPRRCGCCGDRDVVVDTCGRIGLVVTATVVTATSGVVIAVAVVVAIAIVVVVVVVIVVVVVVVVKGGWWWWWWWKRGTMLACVARCCLP